MAGSLEGLGQDHSVLGVKVTLGATIGAPDALSLLPQGMGVVGFMRFAIACIDAAAVDELVEIGFIRSFVDGQAAFHALEVSSRLLKGVLVGSLWVLLLDFQELLDGAGPCELFAQLVCSGGDQALVLGGPGGHSPAGDAVQ